MVIAQLKKQIELEKADIIVGIPSFNEADNISFVTKQVDEGLTKYFSEYKSLIVNIDNNSEDNTKEVFLSTETKTQKCYITTPADIRGKGNNLKNLFNIVRYLNAKAAVIIDADIKSINPKWILYFLEPIFEGYDYVTPEYSRHRYDGTITNNICYPLIYGLFCENIRQPIAGDFAFSSKLNDYWIKKRWYESTKQFGIDIFMTTHAIFGDFKICTVGLGAKIHKPSSPKLGAMFTQVVRTLFINILNRRKELSKRTKVNSPVFFGESRIVKPQDVVVNLEKIKEKSIERFDEYRYIIQHYLPKKIFKRLNKMYSKGKLEIDYKLWTYIVYELINSYSKTLDKGEVIECMKSLYFGRAASFIQETLEMDHDEAEAEIRKQAEFFFNKRNYLIEKLRFLDNKNNKNNMESFF